MSRSEELDLEAVVQALLRKRPVTILEEKMAKESHKSVMALRGGTLRIAVELLAGRPLNKKETSYIYSLALSSMRKNKHFLWDDEVPLRYVRDFWRWATK